MFFGFFCLFLFFVVVVVLGFFSGFLFFIVFCFFISRYCCFLFVCCLVIYLFISRYCCFLFVCVLVFYLFIYLIYLFISVVAGSWKEGCVLSSFCVCLFCFFFYFFFVGGKASLFCVWVGWGFISWWSEFDIGFYFRD